VSSPLAAGGLLLDVAGALMLASAFIFKRPSSVRSETAGYWGANPYLFVSLAKQTADAWIGGALLASGFLAQLLSAANVRASWLGVDGALAAAGAVDLLALLALWRVLRPFNVRRALELELTQRWHEYERDQPSREEASRVWWQGLVPWAHAAGVERQTGEPLHALGCRLLGKRRWRRLKTNSGLPQPPAETAGTPEQPNV
jgi:hypothetical protein